MAGPQEFHSFVRKFVNLWQSGFHAKLYVESEAGNAFVNLQLGLGQAQPAHGDGQAVGGSRLRRRERRAAERRVNAVAEEAVADEAAAVKAAEEVAAAEVAEEVKAAEEAAAAKSAEEAAAVEVAEEITAGTGLFKCDVCEKMFSNGKNMRIHQGKQHKATSSPIPQFDGSFCSDFAVYEFTFESHETCTDDDIIENLNTNFHCPLDDRKIEKNDPIRYFTSKKTNEILEENKILKVFKVSAKDDETAVNLIESWKTFGNFDDRAFNNSVHWDITIRIKDMQRLF